MRAPPPSLPGEDLPDDVATEIGALFAGPPDAFVAGRDRLAAELKAEGQGGLAAEVKRLRRPTLAAWALNNVAHEQPDLVAGFRDAAAAVGRAQEQGDDPAALRAAIGAHRDTRRAVTDAAVETLARHGANAEAARDEIAATLDAAALDPGIGDALAAGRLERAAAAGSAFQVLAPNPAAAPRASRRAERPAPPDTKHEARERERQAARDARILAAASRVDEARRAVEDAQATRDAAEIDVRRARKALDTAEVARDKADRQLVRAREAEQRAQDAFDAT